MKITALLVFVSASLLTYAAPASATCGTHMTVPQYIAAADVVFVGTVTGVEDQGRSAVVAVEATWKGPTLAGQVAVTSATAGGLDSDRQWTIGQRYLFMPENDSSPFSDNGCSGTRVYSSALDRFAPPGGIPSGSPNPGPRPRSSGPGSLIAIIVFIALAAAALNQVRRMRRAALPTWHDPTVDPKDDLDLRH